MKINFKQPRYVLPLILLPFLCLFFYAWKSSFGKDVPVQQNGNTLQETLVDVSEEVKNKGIEDKLDAYRKQYKDADGYTAVGGIADEQTNRQKVPDLYNQMEKRMLDSIDREMKRKYGNTAEEPRTSHSTFPNAVPKTQPPKTYDTDRDLATALSKLKHQQSAPTTSEVPGNKGQTDPMKIFREQMSLIDSMGKANDPDYKSEQAREKAMALAERELKNQKKLSVSKTSASTALFNTISANGEDSFIRAIVDQDITGYAGSRLRIRLLDDMTAGRFLVKKGTYLYAQITGFSGQRVNLSISSIFQNNNILPVRLDIYDNDGLPGLYVPASAFREFSKVLGSDASQGMTIQQQAENNNQLVMSMLQKMFQSTTTAVSKLIRSNKAKLKYNTQVYLIDPQELKNNQNKY
ncbi:Conjugative transposon TraM [Pedobacter cryoconitis]|uniref:Conjugative transposon TraM n=1 Tax=Pedobacter cryoconitis TaxID=188932 RepID=A0A127VEN3_9SPHI|nr:conjugative transposon protein TraM [Pedobacter cryoconitis]AMP99785.1 Conjugative transposon TraM [Pedobacter cryoconitis]